MGIEVFAIVLLAAALHALWNALVKVNGEKYAAMVAVAMGEGALALLLLPFVPVPPIESWPYMAAGIFFHVGYKLALASSYRIGDLTQVYPLARGSAPLIVALVSTAFLGEQIGGFGLAGVALIGLGIMSLAMTGRSDGTWTGRPAILALLTGGFIAGYTIVDGLGARMAGSAHGYWIWLALIDAVLFVAIVSVTRRASPVAMVRGILPTGLIGGAASFCAYWLVVWALTLAPMAQVAALRETSIIFALLIGVVFMREKLNLKKFLATLMTFAGVVVLRLQR